MSKIIKVIVCLHLVFYLSCDECFFKVGRKEYFEVSQIPIAEENERMKKLTGYSAETQIDIYLYASVCDRNPSITGLFEKTGKDRIPDIVRRIQKSKSEKDKYFLIKVINDMNWKCHCINQDAIKILSDGQSEILENDIDSQRFFKEGYKGYLENIVNQSK